jgi:hypothetical protein
MKVKGTAVETLPIFIKLKHGEQAVSQWLDKLQPATKKEFDNGILSSIWYPLRELFIEPTQVLCDLFYGGKMDGAVEVGRFSAEHALKGIYRFFVKLGSPESLIERASTIFPTYYQPSSMEMADKTKTSVIFRITRFEEPHAIVEQRILGWIESALRIAGSKSPRVRILSSMAAGAARTDIACEW